MNKTAILFFLVLIFSCVKPTEDEIVLESMKGEWWLETHIENLVETKSINENVLITIFDIEKNTSRINIKNFNSDILTNEKEGDLLIENNGKTYSIRMDSSSSKTVYEMSFIDGKLKLKNDMSYILYKR